MNLQKLHNLLDAAGCADTDPAFVAELQAVLFASEYPVTMRRLREFFPDHEPETIDKGLVALFTLHEAMGIQLNRMGGGYLFTTAPELGPVVRRFMGARSGRLSAAALETLAIIAYTQPCTQLSINELRGVSSDSSLKFLMDRGLIKSVGRKNEPGRPILYGTTREFLTFFNLNSIAELPELAQEEEREAKPQSETLHLLKDLITSTQQSLEKSDARIEGAFKTLEEQHDAVRSMELTLMTALGMHDTPPPPKESPPEEEDPPLEQQTIPKEQLAAPPSVAPQEGTRKNERT